MNYSSGEGLLGWVTPERMGSWSVCGRERMHGETGSRKDREDLLLTPIS
jgi:hypothetical protein